MGFPWSALNPFNWLTRRKSASSPGEQKILALLPGWGWNSVAGSWAANRYELVLHYRGWNYVAIHHFALAMAQAMPQVAWVEDATAAQGQLTKAWFSRKNYRGGRLDQRLQAKRVAHVRSKWMSRLHRKSAMANIQEGDELVPYPADHRLCRLLRKPNRMHTRWDLGYIGAMYKRLAGGYYLYAVPGRDGKPAELWPLPPHWLRPIGSREKLIAEYEIRPVMSAASLDMGLGWMVGAGGRDTIPAEQIIQIGYPHPTHYLDFYSPLEAGSDWTDTAESIERSRIASFQNGAFPGVVIEIDKEVADPNGEEVQRIKERIVNAYSGVYKTRQPVVLGKGMTMRAFTTSNLEMDYAGSAPQARDNLLALHHTSSSQVGLGDLSTFAGQIASKANFYQSVVNPELMHESLILTERLAPMFADDEERRKTVIYFEDSSPKDPAQKLSDATGLLSAGAKTINEVRAEYGLEPFPYGGDDPCLPMGSSPVPWATGQEDDWMPAPGAQQEQPGQLENGTPDDGQPETSLSKLEQAFGRGKGLLGAMDRLFAGNGHQNGHANGRVKHFLPEAVVDLPPEPLTKGDVAALMKGVASGLKADLAQAVTAIEERIEAIPQPVATIETTDYKRDEANLVERTVKRREAVYPKAWKEDEHPRGQPGNAGEFGPGGNSKEKPGKKPKKKPDASPPDKQVAADDWKENGTKAKAFKEWFGDWEGDPKNASKVVDAEGTPLVVYHGATQKFDAFNSGAIFFSDDKDIAKGFADRRAEHAGEDNPEPRLIEAYVSIKRPFVIDAKGTAAGEIQFSRGDSTGYRAALASDKYDGIIIKNTRDEGTLYVAKVPHQVKSTNNSGAFDPSNPHMGKSLK